MGGICLALSEPAKTAGIFFATDELSYTLLNELLLNYLHKVVICTLTKCPFIVIFLVHLG